MGRKAVKMKDKKYLNLEIDSSNKVHSFLDKGVFLQQKTIYSFWPKWLLLFLSGIPVVNKRH